VENLRVSRPYFAFYFHGQSDEKRQHKVAQKIAQAIHAIMCYTAMAKGKDKGN